MPQVRTKATKSPSNNFESIGVGWWIFIAVVFLIGSLFQFVQVSFPEWIIRMIPKVEAANLHTLLSLFLLAMCVNQVLSYYLSLALTKLFKLKPWTTRENLYPPAMIGLVESGMYPIFFLADKPEYIGGWIALKVAGGWKRWQGNDKQKPQQADEPRRRFYKFLIGNAFTVAVALVTYGIIFSSLWKK